MGKVSKEARQYYYMRIKRYKQMVVSIENSMTSLLSVAKADPQQAGYKYYLLGDEELNKASYYLLQNSLSVELLGIKNESILNDARKSCYQAMIYLEKAVGDYIDAPFSEYSDKLDALTTVDDSQRYFLACKAGFTIQSVGEGFGDNSKWHWSFVELEGRYAAIVKNLINFKTVAAGMDPHSAGYEDRMDHLYLAEKMLDKAADRYREKYESSTLRMDDFKNALTFLKALRRMHIVLGNADAADAVKKKWEAWKSKMEADERKSE